MDVCLLFFNFECDILFVNFLDVINFWEQFVLMNFVDDRYQYLYYIC